MREAEYHVMQPQWIRIRDLRRNVSLGDAESLNGIEAEEKERIEKFDGSG